MGGKVYKLRIVDFCKNISYKEFFKIADLEKFLDKIKPKEFSKIMCFVNGIHWVTIVSGYEPKEVDSESI